MQLFSMLEYMGTLLVGLLICPTWFFFRSAYNWVCPKPI